MALFHVKNVPLSFILLFENAIYFNVKLNFILIVFPYNTHTPHTLTHLGAWTYLHGAGRPFTTRPVCCSLHH